MPDDTRTTSNFTPLLIDAEARLDDDASLSTLARAAGYSAFHFHRLFSQTVGATPKAHFERLRLERGAYLLAVTDDSVLEIALAVGFNNHETFTRAFKKFHGMTPRRYREASLAGQRERLETLRDFHGDGCALSEVRFVTLPALTLLATRRLGTYLEFPLPYTPQDDAFSAMRAWAKANAIAHDPTAWTISYDNPALTPRGAQRIDACIAVAGEVSAPESMRLLPFASGKFAMIEHSGEPETVIQAYYACADGIRRSGAWALDEGPPIQIYRRLPPIENRNDNLTEVYFPVRSAD